MSLLWLVREIYTDEVTAESLEKWQGNHKTREFLTSILRTEKTSINVVLLSCSPVEDPHTNVLFTVLACPYTLYMPDPKSKKTYEVASNNGYQDGNLEKIKHPFKQILFYSKQAAVTFAERVLTEQNVVCKDMTKTAFDEFKYKHRMNSMFFEMFDCAKTKISATELCNAGAADQELVILEKDWDSCIRFIEPEVVTEAMKVAQTQKNYRTASVDIEAIMSFDPRMFDICASEADSSWSAWTSKEREEEDEEERGKDLLLRFEGERGMVCSISLVIFDTHKDYPYYHKPGFFTYVLGDCPDPKSDPYYYENVLEESVLNELFPDLKHSCQPRVSFRTDGLKSHGFIDEKSLLKAFFQDCKSLQVDCFVGFRHENFDLPFLIKAGGECGLSEVFEMHKFKHLVSIGYKNAKINRLVAHQAKDAFDMNNFLFETDTYVGIRSLDIQTRFHQKMALKEVAKQKFDKVRKLDFDYMEMAQKMSESQYTRMGLATYNNLDALIPAALARMYYDEAFATPSGISDTFCLPTGPCFANKKFSMVTSAIYPYYRRAGILTDDTFFSFRIREYVLREIINFHHDGTVPRLTCTRELCEQNWHRLAPVNISSVWEYSSSMTDHGKSFIDVSLRKLIGLGIKRKTGVNVPLLKQYLVNLTSLKSVRLDREMIEKIVKVLAPHFEFSTQIKQPGAFVYPVESGFYGDYALTGFDFSSLYPSLAQANNIGEDTRISLADVLSRKDSLVLWDDVICTKVNYDVENQDLNNPDKPHLCDRALTVDEVLRQMRENGAEFEFHLTKKHKQAVRLQFFSDLSQLRMQAKKKAEKLQLLLDHFDCVRAEKESILSEAEKDSIVDYGKEIDGCVKAIQDPELIDDDLVARVTIAQKISAARSAAIKIVNNSHYGTTTHQCCSSVTRTITGSGREATMNSIRYHVQYRKRWWKEDTKFPVVFAGDTDSFFSLTLPLTPTQIWEFWLKHRKTGLFLRNLGEERVAKLEEALRKRDTESVLVKGLLVQVAIDKHFCDELNCYSRGKPLKDAIYTEPMNLEMERVMFRFFASTKKHYCALEFKPNSCTFKQVVKGVEIKRRNTPEMVKRIQILFFKGMQDSEKPSLILPYRLMAEMVRNMYRNNCGDDLKLIARRLTKLQAPSLFKKIVERKETEVAALSTTHVLALPIRKTSGKQTGPIEWETLEKIQKLKDQGEDITRIVDVEKILEGFFKIVFEWTNKICPKKTSKEIQELCLRGEVGTESKTYSKFVLPPPIIRALYKSPNIPLLQQSDGDKQNYLLLSEQATKFKVAKKRPIVAQPVFNDGDCCFKKPRRK